MPNFGKVYRFRKFNINPLKLQEVLLFEIRGNGVTSIHNSKGEQKKAENPSVLLIFPFSNFHQSGHFLFISMKKLIAHPRTIIVPLFNSTKLLPSGRAIFGQSDKFLSNSLEKGYPFPKNVERVLRIDTSLFLSSHGIMN
jgi:hypothetical protein